MPVARSCPPGGPKAARGCRPERDRTRAAGRGAHASARRIQCDCPRWRSRGVTRARRALLPRCRRSDRGGAARRLRRGAICWPGCRTQSSSSPAPAPRSRSTSAASARVPAGRACHRRGEHCRRSRPRCPPRSRVGARARPRWRPTAALGLRRGLPMRGLLLSLIRGYQRVVSPMLMPRCRFAPSCSDYAREAIAVHGAARGSWLAVRRVSRCHPFHPGGYDPVPLQESTPSQRWAKGAS